MRSSISRRNRLRKVWLAVHRYLGLFAGFVFVIIGLTGSCNVFWKEVDELLNPELVVKKIPGSFRSLDEIMQSVLTAHPELTGSWMLGMPRHDRAMIMAWYLVPEAPMLMVSVDPYTAGIESSRHTGETVVTWIYNLHWQLLFGETGNKILGILGLLLMVSLVSGVYLWWPCSTKVKQAFRIKRGAGSGRFIFDLHRVTGIHGAVLLFVLAFSGVYLVYGDYVKPIVSVFSPVREAPQPKSGEPGGERISIAQAVAIADRSCPNTELRWVYTPAGPDGVFKINKRRPHEAKKSFGSCTVWIDQYSGAVLATRDAPQFSAGETFLNLMWPIHNGEALGLPGRILVFVTGFVQLVLYITGLMRWVQKRKGKRSVRFGIDRIRR